MENARFAFNGLRDFYRIIVLHLMFCANLLEITSPTPDSGALVRMLFLRTLCWAAFVKTCSCLALSLHNKLFSIG